MWFWLRREQTPCRAAMTVEILAPAKINLALHITGKRDDGYHLLDSLVAFGPACDRLIFEPADVLSLKITGPEAPSLSSGPENLVLRAARLIFPQAGARITLEKNLPVSAGIGGGSADAAAVIRGMMVLANGQGNLGGLDEAQLSALGPEIWQLGADVPVCLWSRAARVGGIGEQVLFHKIPPVACVLVNPRVPLSTPQVFGALASKQNPPLPDVLPDFHDGSHLIDWLKDQRNDLEPPARAMSPEIDRVLAALRELFGCAIARMSGSGATCFGLFADADRAKYAALDLANSYPHWWVEAGLLADRPEWLHLKDSDS